MMMIQHGISAAFLLHAPAVAAGGNSGGFYFQEAQDVLSTMQNTYWNGSYWPSTIQWTGALINTIVASTERTYSSALVEYQGSVPETSTSASSIEADIDKYFSQIKAYYDNEDTNQIFDAAYDDAQWVVLEWLEAIKFVKQHEAYSRSSYGNATIQQFAHRAHIFYKIVQDKFDTSLCEGGITWNPALATYKNAITNELFISSSIAMYLYFPGDSNTDPYPSPDYQSSTNKTLPALPALAAHDPLLLDNAAKEWAWFKSHNFTNSQGLIVDGFHISDGQTTCDDRNNMTYTYNQGVLLSGLRGLWEATGDISYLDDGYALVDSTINATGWNSSADVWAGLGRNGIMEDYCDAPANCSQDNLVFKGAYFEHLDLFCEPLPTNTPLVDGLTFVASTDLAQNHASNCASYIPWVQRNADAALSTRNSSNIIGEWWGAPALSATQTPSPQWAPMKPSGSIDIYNQPWLLNTPPWRCDGKHGCDSHRNNPTYVTAKRQSKRQSSNDTRTVETQAQGLSVVKAAADLMLKRRAYSDYFDNGY